MQDRPQVKAASPSQHERRIPKDPAFDGTFAVLRDGYRFILNRCRKLNSDLFETRLLLRRAVCIHGEDAAKIFYDGERFTRVGAIPPTQAKLLQDYGSVQGLDGEHHRHRKRMFTELLAPDEVARLTASVAEEWIAKLPVWERQDRVILFDELQEILCRGVCDWAGISMSERDVRKRTLELGEMIEAAGSLGPRNWRAQWLRSRCERWARGLIEGARSGAISFESGSPVNIIAQHREPDGSLLAADVAAVELINLLRPTVAIARFIMFAAVALHEHPDYQQRIRGGDRAFARAFAQEVRRAYPFFPFIAGRARLPFKWNGHAFAKDDWVLLDIYGTNRDPRSYAEAETFRPERFLDAPPGIFAFVPQGAGDAKLTHRCPGEDATVAIMVMALTLLTKQMAYRVPEQDLSFDLASIPALPKSRFVIDEVRSL
jgi:fatty-acid peroxygenase